MLVACIALDMMDGTYCSRMVEGTCPFRSGDEV